MEDLASFQFHIDGATHARACFELVVALRDRKPGVLPFAARQLDRFRQDYGGAVRFVQFSDSAKARKIKPGDFDVLSAWGRDKAMLAERMAGVELHSGEVARLREAPDFAYLHDDPPKGTPGAVVRIVLPLESAKALTKLADDWVAGIGADEIAFGWATHSFLWNSGSYEASDIQAWLKPILKRHPGFSHGEASAYATWSKSGIPFVGWLTLLGPTSVKALGGFDTLAKAAKEAGVGCTKVGKESAVLRAGNEPSIGDVNRGDKLPLRRAVGRLVDLIRMPDETVRKMMGVDGFKRDEACEWFMRFFRD